MIARETDADHLQVTAKQEGNATDDQKTSKASSSSASSWSRLKDPRIVRVSRAFGGKDRHSKVCTVRGLRDRRVRLSVPTAIQLYDLQDRLGLNQPSKVVDWLLNAAKHEIDELPPLQMPPGSFIDHNFRSVLASHGGGTHPSNKLEGLRIGGNINWDDPSEPSGSNAWDSDALLRSKAKEVARETSSEDKGTWTRNEEGKQQSNNFGSFFPRSLGHSSSPSLGLLNSTVPYNSLIKWDPSNLSLSPQQEDFHHNFNVVPLPSTMSMPSGGHHQQVLVYHQPGISVTQPYDLPSHIAGVTPEYFPKEINFQMLNSSSENQLSNSLEPPIIDSSSQHGVRHFHLLSTNTTKLLSTQNDCDDKEDDNNEFHSSR